MEIPVLSDNKGFTLIEALIAFAILIVVMLGLMYGQIVAVNYNINNLLRDTAVKIAQEEIEKVRNTKYDNLSDESTDPNYPKTVTRTIRNTTETFTVHRRVETSPSGELKKVTVTVEWQAKLSNNTHSYSLETIVREPGT